MRIPATSLTLLSVLSLSASALAATPVSRPSACPVSVDIHHSSASYKQVVGKDLGVVTPSLQVLELTIHNDGPAGVTSIQATLQMRSDAAHTQPLIPGREAAARPGERIPLQLVHAVDANRDVLLIRTVPNRNPVEYIELNQVTFADGSRWTAAKDSACRFTPNLITLIAAQ